MLGITHDNEDVVLGITHDVVDVVSRWSKSVVSIVVDSVAEEQEEDGRVGGDHRAQSADEFVGVDPAEEAAEDDEELDKEEEVG